MSKAIQRAANRVRGVREWIFYRWKVGLYYFYFSECTKLLLYLLLYENVISLKILEYSPFTCNRAKQQIFLWFYYLYLIKLSKNLSINLYERISVKKAIPQTSVHGKRNFKTSHWIQVLENILSTWINKTFKILLLNNVNPNDSLEMYKYIFLCPPKARGP